MERCLRSIVDFFKQLYVDVSLDTALNRNALRQDRFEADMYAFSSFL